MAQAQTGSFDNAFLSNRVGGIRIGVDGVLDNVDPTERAELREARLKLLAKQPVPGELKSLSKMRLVSLKGIEKEVAAAAAAGKPIPDEVRYLGGLLRVKYVFIDPEKNDILLAGPGEGWTANADGHVVGATTGRPVIELDDLLVALRYADQARSGGISCSIDPTADGINRMKAFVASQTSVDNPREVADEMERLMGKQVISVGGVPDDSRLARIMVVADYRMKRLAMAFEKPPVSGLPSYLDMLGSRVSQNMLPRWWLAANYEPLSKSADGLTWELNGQGVKCETEDDFLAANGTRSGSGRSSPIAKKWADNMTAKYTELSAKDPAFAQLRNAFDLAVVGALIQKENLLAKANCKLPTLLDKNRVQLEKHNVPREVDSKATLLKKGRNWLFSVSGGVQFQPWQWIQNSKEDPTLDATKKSALSRVGARWVAQ